MSCFWLRRATLALFSATVFTFALLFTFSETFALIDRIIIFSGGFVGMLASFFANEAYYAARQELLVRIQNDQKVEPVDRRHS